MENKSRMRATSIVKGTLMLSVAGIIVRLLGALFRIPLTHIIGAEGMGVYSLAFPLYNFFLVIASAGLPSAVAAWVSKCVGVGDYSSAYRGFKAALSFLFVSGCLFTLTLFIGAPIVGRITDNQSVIPVIRAISFSVLFVSVISAFRGYFQGMCHMTPTAISQIWEQIIKLIAGILFAYVMGLKGGSVGGAIGAGIGVSISELAGLLVMIIMYLRRRSEILSMLPKECRVGMKYTQILGELLKRGIPLMLGAMVIPIVMLCDQYIVISSLKGVSSLFSLEGFLEYCNTVGVDAKGILSLGDAQKYMLEVYDGYKAFVASSLYGIYTGSVLPLVNLPSVLVMSLCVSSLPVVARENAVALSRGVAGRESVVRQSRLVMSTGAFILTPFAVCTFFLAEIIMTLLYKGAYTSFEMDIAIKLLKISAPTVLFMGVFQSIATLMQAISRERVPPIITSICSVTVRLVLTALLCSLPSLNVLGVALSSLGFFGVVTVISLMLLSVYLKDRGIITTTILPLLSGVVMGSIMYLCMEIFKEIGVWGALISTIIGAAGYILGCFLTGIIDKGDIMRVKGLCFKGRSV